MFFFLLGRGLQNPEKTFIHILICLKIFPRFPYKLILSQYYEILNIGHIAGPPPPKPYQNFDIK